MSAAAFAVKPNTAKLEKGMTITVEPGVYKEEARHPHRTRCLWRKV